MNKSLLNLGLALGLAMSFAARAEEVATPHEKCLSLPGIWQTVDPGARIAALREAELDGTRLLLERVYGVNLTATTRIYDLALASDQVRGALSELVRGVSTTEEPSYLEDGTVQVVRSVQMRTVIETLTRRLRELETRNGLVPVETLEKIERQNRNVVLEVKGSGALSGSKGMRRLQAKRAAEMYAYRKLAERISGMQLSNATTVKDFMLESDQLRASCAALVKGARPIEIAYASDDSCEVKMQIKVSEAIEIIRHHAKGKVNPEELTRMEQEYETKTFTETGYGSPRPLDQTSQSAVASGSGPQTGSDTYQETEIVIRRVIGQNILME